MHKNNLKIFLLIFSVLSIGILLYSPFTHAANWVNLPPYNTLWPLWSPALSPINDITGLATPIITSLAPDTVLPQMPGLTWDPSLPYPYLLYNTSLSGLVYFDPFAGINSWPAPSLLDNAGQPAPIALPANYQDLPATDALWLANNIFTANLYYNSFFPPIQLATPVSAFGTLNNLAPLLTPFDILGPVLSVPSALVPAAAIASPIIAEQIGIWQGTWISLTKTLAGPMNLELVENPETGLSGTAHLVDNKLIPDPVEVAGAIPVGNFFQLTGSYVNPSSGALFDIKLDCILQTDIYMTGTYYIQKVGFTMSEYGEFTLNLTTPPITIPVPSIIPLPPATAPVVPVTTTTIPVLTAPVTLPVPILTPPLTATVPVAPVITTLIASPTAAVSGLFLPWQQLPLPNYPVPFGYPFIF